MNKMKKVIVLAAFMFVMFGFAATAQTPQKIGYADVEYVLSQMPQFKDVQSEIQTYQTQLQKQYEAKVNPSSIVCASPSENPSERSAKIQLSS